MKLAIVIGHNAEKQGATRVDTLEREYRYNTRLADAIADLTSEHDVRIFRRVLGGGYKLELARVYDDVDDWGADASIELHFNSHAKKSATGTEVLSSSSEKSVVLATNVQAEMVEVLGLRDRGIKTRARSDRGGGSLYSGRAPAILIEPFFGSNEVDCKIAGQTVSVSVLARAILAGAEAAFATFPRKEIAESRTIQGVQKIRRKSALGILAGASSAATQLAEVVVGDAESVTDAAIIGSGLSQYLPQFGAGLAVLCIALFIFNRLDGDKIEDARLEDHAKGVR